MIRALVLAAAVLWAFPALAVTLDNNGRYIQDGGASGGHTHLRRSASGGHMHIRRGDPRPGRWCAWWLRRHLGIPRTAFHRGAYNQARAFARVGRPAPGPGRGRIVVWRHHVGLITGMDANGNWMVLSGNDGGAVRERPRSLRGAIAYRYPP